jgi:hypothetical protein
MPVLEGQIGFNAALGCMEGAETDVLAALGAFLRLSRWQSKKGFARLLVLEIANSAAF